MIEKKGWLLIQMDVKSSLLDEKLNQVVYTKELLAFLVLEYEGKVSRMWKICSFSYGIAYDFHASIEVGLPSSTAG